ncbi:MAG: C25 family cysteine peptidase [Verrucomicrobiota bacterium]
MLTLGTVEAGHSADPGHSLQMSVTSFRAELVDDAVSVQWETQGEAGTIGFNLFRLDEKTGPWQAVNERLLVGLLVAPQGGTYGLVDTGAVPGRKYLYKLEDVEARGTRNVYGPFEVFVTAAAEGSAKKAVLARHQTAPADLANGKALEYARTARPLGVGTRLRARLAAKTQARTQQALVQGNQVKAYTSEEGLYYASAADLAAVLNLPAAVVQWMISKYYFLMMNQGRYANYIAAANGAGLYWYGEALDSIYTKENVYWLSWGRGGTLKTVSGRSPRSATREGTFMDSIHFEEDRVAATAVFQDPEADVWLWCYLVGPVPGFDRTNLTARLDGVATSGTARVAVQLKGGSITGVSPEHHAVVRVNGVQVGEGRWTGFDECRIDAAFNQGILREGDNTVEVQDMPDSGAPYSVVYVDSLDLTYSRYCRAVDGRLLVRGDGNKVVTVGGFTNNQISVVDVTNPRQPAVLKNTTIDSRNGSFRVSFVPASRTAEYFVFTGGGVRAPERMEPAAPTCLTLPGNRARYLVITAEGLAGTAQALADYRAGQGLESKVVDLETIYDAFNYGIASPHAIRGFLKHAYRFWSAPPEYVVLAGNGTFDFKDHLGFGDNLVPTKMVDTPDGLFESDTWFGDVDDNDGVPEIAVGRLPVLTARELSDLVGKITAYEGAATVPGDWSKQTMFVADNPDDAGDFTNTSDRIAAFVPGGYVVNRVYLPTYSVPAARTAILNGWNAGLLFFNYVGHGLMDRLADENLFSTSNVPSLVNGEKQPVAVLLTCLAGRYAVPGYDCLSEALVLRNGGGAAGVWSPTGLSMNYLAEVMGQGLYRARFVDGNKVLGDAILQSLYDYGPTHEGHYMLYIYNLLGDPALQMK